MPVFPPVGSLLAGPGRFNGDRTPLLENLLAAAKALAGGPAGATLAIAGGRIVPTAWRHVVDTEGAAATDDLDRVAAMEPGTVFALRIADASRPVQVRHAQGTAEQILLNGGAHWTMTGTTQALVLVREASAWVEWFRWPGASPSAWRALVGIDAAAAYPMAVESEARAGASSLLHLSPLRGAQMLATAALVVGNRAALPAGPLAAGDQILVARTVSGVPTLFRAAASQLVPEVRESGEFPVAASGDGSFAHGLGAAPRRLWAVYRCKVADNGYGVGTEIPAEMAYSGGLSRGPTLWADAEDAGYALTANVPAVSPPGGGEPAAINPARWVVVLRCSG